MHLGHGPWSHFWEQYLRYVNNGEVMNHEDLSIQMLERLLDVNDLRPKLLKYGIDDQDITFIKELISGPIDPETGLPSRKPQAEPWPYRGRPEEKGFLYEIVANKENGKRHACQVCLPILPISCSISISISFKASMSTSGITSYVTTIT